jgi:hypothetical protein
MKIDGKEFKTYLLDNEFTIKRRFAKLNNVIPDFIHFELVTNFPENEYESKNLVKIIKESNINEIENVFKINEKHFFLTTVDFICLWCYVKYKSSIPPVSSPDFFMLNEFLDKHNVLLDHIDNNMSYFLKKIKDKLEYLNESVENEVKLSDYFDKIKETDSSDLEVTKIKKEYVYTINVDSCNFFDSINLSNDIPFVSFKEFYKVFKDFKPLTKWIFLNDDLNIKDSRNKSISEKDIITLKVSNMRNTPILKELESELKSNEKEQIVELKEKKIQDMKDEMYSNVYITFKSSWDEYLEEKKQKEKKELREKQQLKLINIASEKEKEKEKIIRRKGKDQQEDKEKREEKRREREELLKKQEEEEKQEKELEKRRIEMELEETIKQKKKEYKMFILIETNITDNKDGELKENEMLQRVLSSFSIPVKLLKEGVEKQIQSEFLIPNQIIDFPIIKDMFFNNLIFKKFLQLDERLSIYKYKRNMYFYFIPDINDNKSNYIGCSMTQKKIEKMDTKIIAKDPSKLTLGSYYIELKILRCLNLKLSQQFKKIFCKFISYYNNNKDKVINEYKEILNGKNVNKILEDERKFKEQKRYIRQKELLKDVDPEKFIPGYARICEKKFAPKILNENEIEKYFGENSKKEDIEKRKHMMLYPKTEEEGKQYYYSCLENKKNHLYPGLQKNYLDNFDKYPVVPCCFVTEQSKKIDSPFDLYYGDKNLNFEEIKEYFLEKEEKDTASHIIKTQKFIPTGRFGVLPKDIISFLHSIDPKNQYYRKGSIRSVDSILDVLLYARKSDYDNLSISEKYKYIKKMKEKIIKIISDNNIQYLQESYNVNMIQMLNDDNSYINPHIFHKILEYIFDCNIIIFTRNEQNPDGTLSCPYYDKEYLQFEQDKEKKYILIYEHMGAETDNAKYPQCEVIFRYEENTIYPTFKYDNFIESIDNCFTQMFPIKRFNNINSSFKKYKIKSYGVNEFGKTINIILEKKTQNKDTISIITNPLPNLDIDTSQYILSFSKYDKFNDNKKSYEFGLDENIKLTSFVKDGIFYGFQGQIDNIKFYIPTIPTKTSGNVPNTDIDFPVIDPKTNQISLNKLEIYNEFKNVSRLLVEYFYYLFSIDYNLYKPELVDNEYINDFIKRNIVIKSEKIDYSKLISNSRIFNIDIFKKSKTLNSLNFELPVPNRNILDKLVYNLKLKLDREYIKLLNYNNLQYVPSSYSEIDDFKYSLENNNIVIKGKYPMIQWIKSIKNNYSVYDHVQLPKISVYNEIYNILDENQKNNLLLLVFVSKWSKPSKNIQNKLYSNKTHKLIFDRYKDIMTIIYIDIDNHKAFSDYFSIKNLPTFIFSNLDNENKILKIVSRIEGDIKMYKNLKLLNSEIKNILNIKEVDEISKVLNNINDDSQLDKQIDEALEDVIGQLDIELQELEDLENNDELSGSYAYSSEDEKEQD